MAALEIVEERKKGEFKSLVNFCERVDSRVTNKRMIEALIYSGAFDCFGVSRRELLFTSEDIRTHGQMTQKQRAMGQVSIEDFLFGDDEAEIEAEPPKPAESKELRLSIADFEILLAEKKSLSDYISGHPLTVAHKFTNGFFPNTSDVRKSRLDENVKALGVIINVDKKLTVKKQQNMAVFELEDNRGKVRCVMFHDGFEKYKEFLDTEDIYLVEGKWSNSNEEERNIVVTAMYPLMTAVENNIPSVKIYLRPDATKDEIGALYTLVRNHKGELPAILEIEKESHIISLNLNSNKVKPSYSFFEAMDAAHISYELASRKGVFQAPLPVESADEGREEFENADNYDEFEGEENGYEESDYSGV
jgi:DNA polymerase-3 subunit alpha